MQKSQRLFQLMMMVNARKAFTVQELADELGVSSRTITRDLLELSELGVPVYSVQGRGGGYRLLQERMLPPISFTEGEAVAIFFACQSLEYFGSLPFGDGASSALHKFFHYLPADVKCRIERLKNRIAIYSPYRQMSPDILQTLLHAIMDRSIVTIRYRSSKGVQERNIQPVGLYASSGYWYCPAYCFLRKEMRQFRADRMLSAIINPAMESREDIERQTLLDKPEKDQLEQTVLLLELTEKGIWQLDTNTRFAPFIKRNEDGTGTAAVQIAAEDLHFYVELIWALGEDVRIMGPTEAVAQIKQKMKAMHLLYEQSR
ncbi:YafY family protein [Paenibacillus sp. LHD-38]|uniref:helix-turn-helix transcriptional regulator n=1 Tax=Paenibacillus sp. LHD-38 TaxID=3072143 RepID=UPI00280E4763|nr:YafY family protein [Paenibacillus sp. LHD-38]MDQ8734611.1 YafY family protein [Paenibacillus sp. LHD-38]